METHVTFVLDSSGSMSAIAEDTTGGFNSFVRSQREEEGTATVSLFEFNTIVKTVYEGYPIDDAPELTSNNYIPGGQTALHDAIHMAILETKALISGMQKRNRPDTVVVVVLTDGKENASETPQSQVREQVEHCRTELGWEFLFIGANQDAALTADRIGMDSDRSLNMAQSGDGARAAYESTSDRISQARREGSTGSYSDTDRQRQDDARNSRS